MVTGWLWWLVLGALIGWGVGWVIGWLYWRRQRAALTKEIETLRVRVGTMSSERDQARAVSERCTADLSGARAQFATLSTERDELKTQFGGLQAELDVLRTERDGLKTQAAAAQSSLTALTSERDGLHAEITGLRANLDTLTNEHDDLLARVGRLSSERDGFEHELSGLRANLDTLTNERDGLQSELAELRPSEKGRTTGDEGAAPEHQGLGRGLHTLRQRIVGLLEINPPSEAHSLALDVADRWDANGMTANTAKPEENAINTLIEERLIALKQSRAAIAAERDQLAAELASYRGQQPTVVRADRLIDIDGIGPVYEKRLNNAAILTFRQLYELSVEEIRAIIKPEDWQQIAPERWIAQARVLDAERNKEGRA